MSRENYQVPKGEEQDVHYKAERVLFDAKTQARLSHPDLIKTNVKMFDDVKRNLELQGYTIEILYHPQGKYTNVTIPLDPATEIREKDKTINEMEIEIKRLKDALAKKAAKEESPVENNGETEKEPDENKGENAESAPARKGGRPKKGE